jgi:hypothetical protein
MNNYSFLQNVQGSPQENGNIINLVASFPLVANLSSNLSSTVSSNLSSNLSSNVNPNSNEFFFQEINSEYYDNGNSNSEIEARVNRNYEALMIERNQELTQNIENNVYNKIFNEIKNKLLIISDETEESVSESVKKEFMETHNLVGIHENINKLKKVIVELHNKKIELEITHSEACLKFKKFSDLVLATVSIIKDSSDSDDKQLSDLLMDKISRYFLLLDLENINKSVTSVNKEYLSIKQLLLELSGMIPGTVCQICLENQINYFMDPCGHTICTYCKEKRPGLQKCHFCRTNISTFKRLYL